MLLQNLTLCDTGWFHKNYCKYTLIRLEVTKVFTNCHHYEFTPEIDWCKDIFTKFLERLLCNVWYMTALGQMLTVTAPSFRQHWAWFSMLRYKKF